MQNTESSALEPRPARIIKKFRWKPQKTEENLLTTTITGDILVQQNVQKNVHYSVNKMLEAISITEAREKFFPLLSKIETELYRFMVTKHGKPVAVVMEYAEYSRMVETLKLLEDRQWSQRLDQGLNQARDGVMLEVNAARHTHV
jgi:prevent-host-death family protein